HGRGAPPCLSPRRFVCNANRRKGGMVSYIAQPVERPAPARIFDTVAYAFVGLLLRLVRARAVFLAGQSRIAGPSFTLGSEQARLTVTLPAHVREEAVRAFETQFGAASIWPSVVAYFFA